MIAIVVLGLFAFCVTGECAITSWTSPVQAGKGGEIGTAIRTLPEGNTEDIFTFTALTDGTGISAYYINSQNPDTGIFEIATPADGVLSLASGKVLDHEAFQTHVLIVTAVDNVPDTGTVTVTISITNVAPAFTPTQITIKKGLVAPVDAGTKIATMTAVDVGATITYAITQASNTNTDFAISSVGDVSTAKVLAVGTKSPYNLVITAADNGTTIKTGTATLVVFVGSGAEGLASGIMSLITLAVIMLK